LKENVLEKIIKRGKFVPQFEEEENNRQYNEKRNSSQLQRSSIP
jgi:hypothetical protein